MNSENFKRGNINSVCSDNDYYNTLTSQKSIFTNISDNITTPVFQHGKISFDDGLQRLRQVRFMFSYVFIIYLINDFIFCLF